MPRVAYDIPVPADLKEAAMWWLNPPPAGSDERWRERCEEHIAFTSHDDSHVRVVGQMMLPEAREASLPYGPGEHLFLIPYFWLGKGESRTSHYELKGTDGGAVPIYPRAANVAITADVFEKFAVGTLGCGRGLVRERESSGGLRPATGSQLPDITLSSLLHRLATGGLVQSRLSLRLIMNMLAAENGVDLKDGELPDELQARRDINVGQRDRYGEELKRYTRLLKDIAVGELLWVPLLGRRGSQVRLELSYTARARRPPFLRQKTRKRIVTLRCTQEKHTGATQVEADRAGADALERSPRTKMTIDGHNLRMRSTTRRIWNSLAHAFGYAPYETLFSAGAMRRWSSYHLHVSAPPGVDIRGAQLLPRLEWDREHHGHVRTEISAERAHLVISKAQFTTQAQSPAALPVRIRMRSAEKRTISFAAGIAWLVAAMLWLFATAETSAVIHNDNSVSDILVIVPALLLAFAARPGEHGFASRVLVGVRTLMLVSGTCCVAAAVVLSGALWQGKQQHTWLHELLIWDALLATLIAGLLTLTVLLTARWLDTPRLWVDRWFDNGRLAEEERKRTGREPPEPLGSRRYRKIAGILFVLQLTFVSLLFRLGHTIVPLVGFGCVIALLALVSAVLAVRGESVRTKPAGTAPLLGLTGALAAGSLVASVTARVTHAYFPQEWGLLAAMVILPAVIDSLSGFSHFQLAVQPGYDFALRQSEGDFDKRPELDERLGTLVDAIFGDVPEQRGWLEKINSVRRDKETVYVDVASIGFASPDKRQGRPPASASAQP
jgi:hypothetical protein